MRLPRAREGFWHAPCHVSCRSPSYRGTWRAKGGMQAQVAQLVGVSRQAVAKWESEVVSNATGSNANTDNRRKLTDDDIAYIIERLAAGDTQQAIADSLADKVKVDRSRIAQIASQYADRILDLKIQRIKLPVTLHGIEFRCTDARDHRSGDLADLAFFSPP